MYHHKTSLGGFARLELVLVLACLALLFQVFPGLWWDLWAALDFRTWSRGTWFALNLLVLLSLFGIRFGPALYADWRNHRTRRRPGVHSDANQGDADYQLRVQRDADWRERAKRRLPWQ